MILAQGAAFRNTEKPGIGTVHFTRSRGPPGLRDDHKLPRLQSMTRTPSQRISLAAAVLIGAAPLAFGFFRAWRTGSDYRMLWMALIASIFAFGVLAASIGKRRSRHAVMVQAIVILIAGTLLAGATASFLGATSAPGVWAVSLVFSICLAASSVFVALARAGAKTG